MERRILLSIAGFDPTGLAGILRDIQVFNSLGFHGCGMITSLTIQSSRKVFKKKDIPQNYIFESLSKIDLDISGIKIGMLNNEKSAMEVLKYIEHSRIKNIVLDPVLFSTSGYRLINEKGIKFMKERIFPFVLSITPNLFEAKALTGEKKIEKILEKLKRLINGFVILKNINGVDIFFDGSNLIDIEPYHRLKDVKMHGSGCVFSSALLSYLSKNMNHLQAAKMAKKYTEEEIISFLKKPVD